MIAVVPVEPMLRGSLGSCGPGWACATRWDGLRCLASWEGGDVALMSRNRRALTRYVPELVDAVRPLGDVVLEGTLVVHVLVRTSEDHRHMRA